MPQAGRPRLGPRHVRGQLLRPALCQLLLQLPRAQDNLLHQRRNLLGRGLLRQVDRLLDQFAQHAGNALAGERVQVVHAFL